MNSNRRGRIGRAPKMIAWSLLACLAVASCGGGVAPTAVAEERRASLPTERQDNAKLLATAVAAAAPLSSATSDELATLDKRWKEFHDAFDAQWTALDAPVTTATVERAAAVAALAAALAGTRVHDTNTYQQRTWCGGDGCGDTCVERCSVSEVCFADHCACVPQCAGKVCGADGCGGFCGANGGGCPDDQVCTEAGTCASGGEVEVECAPSCSLEGRPAREGGKRRAQIYDYSVRGSRASAAGADVDVETFRAWVKALDERVVALQAQAKDADTLDAQLTQAKTARDAAVAELTAAKTAKADAVKAAFAAKVPPTEAPEVKAANERLTTATEAQKKASADVATLTGSLQRARAKAAEPVRALARLLPEKAALDALVPTVEAAFTRRTAAASALEQAIAAREMARAALIAANGKAVDELAGALQAASLPVITAADRALLGCDDDDCAIVANARVESCASGLLATNCPGGAEAKDLQVRLRKAIERRRADVTSRRDADDARKARAQLDETTTALLRLLVADGADIDDAARLAARAAHDRTADGALPESLHAALARLGGSVDDVAAAAEAKAPPRAPPARDRARAEPAPPPPPARAVDPGVAAAVRKVLDADDAIANARRTEREIDVLARVVTALERAIRLASEHAAVAGFTATGG
ncbi:MAG: hypothetical protein FJ137_08415 [Deltaproteobacteria bacterium]|nr:hypothetical protein [Deltaproteobacteria bacterium]